MTVWLVVKNGHAWSWTRYNMDRRPAPTICERMSIGGARRQYHLEDDGVPTLRKQDKPPYRVMSMDEVRALPPSGLKAISTFSGCGGSSLGYRMAGFSLLYASEFIEAARACYEANAAPGTIVDGRDVREVTAESILEKIGLRAGELDLMDGSPPCASFSTAGKRERDWGKVKKYSDCSQRTDDLFFEFTRLLRGIQPKVFVAENVSGLVKGTAKGYFLDVLKEMKACGYVVSAKLLDAQWLGVPQMRQRIIFIGVRSDLGLAPVHPAPLPYRYSVRDALPWIKSVIHDTSGNKNFCMGEVSHKPAPAVSVGVNSVNSRHYKVEDAADISRFEIGKEWNKLKQGEQSSRYFQLVKPALGQPCPTITASGGVSSLAGVTHPTERRKFSIAELKRICGFPDDFTLLGTYGQQWERLGRAVPPVMMMHVALALRAGVFDKLASRDKKKPRAEARGVKAKRRKAA